MTVTSSAFSVPKVKVNPGLKAVIGTQQSPRLAQGKGPFSPHTTSIDCGMGNSTPKLKASSEHEEDFSFRNGGLILQQQVSAFDGRSLPLRVFSLEELHEMGRFMARDSLWTLYRGNYNGRLISVKKFNGSYLRRDRVLEKVVNEIAIASQLGKHGNILKLLGYCAEPELPILVYEHTKNGSLSKYISDHSKHLLPWDSRLRILCELANAVSFLHCGTSRVVVHGDIKPYNIFLDVNFKPKIGDFVLSKLIPLGEDHVNEDIVAGTYGYMAPESAEEARFSEKSDVYGFGVMIFEVLTTRTRRDLYDSATNVIAQGINEFFSAACIAGGGGNIQQQIEECVELTRRSLMRNPEDRPTMVEVAKSLRKIRRLNGQSSDQDTC